MNLVESSVPVVFVNPLTCMIDQMPVEMISAYFPNGTVLCLEEAAKVASIRDHEAAENLVLSMDYSVSVFEGCGFDILSVEPPSLR